MSVALCALVMFAVAAAASLVATGRLIPWLRRRGVMDRPNERSSHVSATPRGGGLAIIGTTIPLWILGDWLTGGTVWHAAAIALLALILAVLCFRDDRGGLPVSLRFGIQILAVAGGLLLVPAGLRIFPIDLPLILDRVVAGFIWLWFVNLYNFMDGIDGLSGTETVFVALGLTAVHLVGEQSPVVIVQGAIIAGAALGFLRWNWHPARVFMGDVGSVPLGFLMGWLMLLTATRPVAVGPAPWEAWGWAVTLVLPAFYWADATLTLLRRLAAGEAVWRPHRTHAYQRAVQGGLTHAQVVWRVIGLNIALFVLAIGMPVGLPVIVALFLAAILTGAVLFDLNRRQVMT